MQQQQKQMGQVSNTATALSVLANKLGQAHDSLV
jgi:hypothetical protein